MSELDEVADRWDQAGFLHSNLDLLRNDPAYDELIAGFPRQDLVRLALSRLHGNGRPQWLMLLWDLVDDPPEVPEESAGVIDDLVWIWFRWADERKIPAYCPPDGKPAVTASGKVLTDLDIKKLSEEAERGYDVEPIVRRSSSARKGEEILRKVMEGETWYVEFIQRILELSSGTRNPSEPWQLNAEDLQSATGFLMKAMRPGLPLPWVGVLGEGGIQLTWHHGGVEVEVVFDSANDEFEMMVIRDDGEEMIADLSADKTNPGPLFEGLVDRLLER